MANKKQDKGKPIFGLVKLPVEALLKASRMEVGKLEAYVDELEYKKAKLKEQLVKVCEENARLAERCCKLEVMLNQAKQEVT